MHFYAAEGSLESSVLQKDPSEFSGGSFLRAGGRYLEITAMIFLLSMRHLTALYSDTP